MSSLDSPPGRRPRSLAPRRYLRLCEVLPGSRQERTERALGTVWKVRVSFTLGFHESAKRGEKRPNRRSALPRAHDPLQPF